MNLFDEETIMIPNESVLCLPGGQPFVLNPEKRKNFIANLNKIEEFHSSSNWDKAAHYLREGWLMSNTFLADLLGPDKLYEYLNMYNMLMMNDEEIRWLKALDDEITVYRGSIPNNDSELSGLSWTWSIDIATVYAVNRNGLVITGAAKKEDILCAFFDEKEYVIKANMVKVTEMLTWKEAVHLTKIAVFE